MDDKQTAVKIKSAGYGDLFLILVGGIILGGLIILAELFPLNPRNPIYWFLGGMRVILGLLFVLYLPGYLLQGMFFPLHADLDSIDRVGLSLGLSVALVTLLVLLVNALPWGLQPRPILISQLSLIIILIVVTAFVRRLIPAGQVYSQQVHPRLRAWWTSMRNSERSMLLTMSGALMIAIITAGWIFLKPSRSQFMTEFYVLGSEGLAESYPREITVGETVTITTGITNREGTTSIYNIQIKLNEQVIGQDGPFTIENDGTWEHPVAFIVPIAGDDQQLTFILVKEGQPSPYRSLRLWLNVKLAQTP